MTEKEKIAKAEAMVKTLEAMVSELELLRNNSDEIERRLISAAIERTYPLSDDLASLVEEYRWDVYEA